MANKKVITEDMNQFVAKHWKTKTDSQIATKFGVSVTTIVRIRRKLGLNKDRSQARQDKYEYIQKYQHLGNHELAKILGISADYVRHIKNDLGIFSGNEAKHLCWNCKFAVPGHEFRCLWEAKQILPEYVETDEWGNIIKCQKMELG